MTMLHFLELGIRGHKAVHALTNAALRDYEDHLWRTKVHQEWTALRLAWRDVASEAETDDKSAWVELADPPDDPDAGDSIFDAFLDEEAKYVQEVGDDGEGNARRGKYLRDRNIRIEKRDSDRRRLKLERRPTAPLLELTPNTRTIQCQIRAIQRLKTVPAAEHMPLLRLFESAEHAAWPWFSPDDAVDSDSWFELKDEERPGTKDQRKFVQIALTTPDFALLEGPPGSGKTTAITELILQLVSRGRRVLLCASTHVAVDNVLERMVKQVDADDSDAVPVRLGDRDKVSKKARRFQIEELRRTERRRLVEFLSTRRTPSESQKRLLSALREGDSAVDRLILDCANVICGTTIGILQHPDLKPHPGQSSAPKFDVLILDEASKTTFQEFLVPAMLARRWVIVGDPKQLSPYVEQREFESTLRAALPDERARDACVDAFAAGSAARERSQTRVVSRDSITRGAVLAEGEARGLRVADARDPDPTSADVVLGSAEDLARLPAPADGRAVRVRGSKADVRTVAGKDAEESGAMAATQWESELAWRLITRFQLRFSCAIPPTEGAMSDARATKVDALTKAIEALLPVAGDPAHREEAQAVIDRTCSIALPSVIEVLQQGNERRTGRGDTTAMSDGLPASALDARHVLLEYQHRMHPDISAAPCVHVYGGRALKDAPKVVEEREWSYARHGSRSVWSQVPWTLGGAPRQSDDEVRVIDTEIREFVKWARHNRRRDDRPWEVAVLPFYRAQERRLREMVRDRTGQAGEYRHFHVGDDVRPDVVLELCTVDRFQGHEADVVLVSFANGRATSFLESQNRLNVALTRARYLRVLVGDRLRLGRSTSSPLLRSLAENEPWARTMEDGR